MASSIQSLPLDVLLEVFLCSIESRYAAKELPVQFTIGSVCNVWRQAAWNCAGLWRTLSICTRFGLKVSHESLLREWLERSKSCTLTIYISNDGGDDGEPTSEIVKTIFDASDRIEKLDIISDSPLQTIQHELRHAAYEFARLRELALEIIPNYEENPYTERILTKVLASAPILESLTLQYGCSGGLLTELPRHFLPNPAISSLARLRFRGEVSYGLFLLHHYASTLKQVDLCLQGDYSEGLPKVTGIIRVPNLTSISIEDNSSNEFMSIFNEIAQCLQLPFLRSCKIELNEYLTDMPQLESLITHSNCNITQLSLEQMPVGIDDEEMIALCQHLPFLTDLNFESAPDSDHLSLSDEFITLLHPLRSQDSGPLLPKLSRFTFLGRITFSPTVMENMIRDQLNYSLHPPHRVKQLEKISIYYTNEDWGTEFDPNELQDFYHNTRALRASGVNFALSWASPEEMAWLEQEKLSGRYGTQRI